MLFLGFSAGLPLLLVFGSLSAWLSRSGINKTTIGYVSWVALLYGFKFIWSPLVDRIELPVLKPLLGQRRSWMVFAQAGVIVGLLSMSLSDPNMQLTFLVMAAILVALSSATQDIVIDAWRIESMPVESQGVMSGTYQMGYRLGMLLAGGGSFLLAHYYSWPMAYSFMALMMSVGVITTLIISEPERNISNDTWQQEKRVIAYLEKSVNISPCKKRIYAWMIGAIVCPFTDFFNRNGSFAIIILLFIGMYRISDISMGIMANPLYIDVGYSDLQIGLVTKTIGPIVTIIGALLGGVLVVRYKVIPVLMAGAILVVITNLLFVLIALNPPDTFFLSLVIGADNLSGGIAGSAFIAYLSGLTNKAYTATQYALFSSLMLLPAKIIGGFSGNFVDSQGYIAFFFYTAALGLPAIVLIYLLSKHKSKK